MALIIRRQYHDHDDGKSTTSVIVDIFLSDRRVRRHVDSTCLSGRKLERLCKDEGLPFCHRVTAVLARTIRPGPRARRYGRTQFSIAVFIFSYIPTVYLLCTEFSEYMCSRRTHREIEVRSAGCWFLCRNCTDRIGMTFERLLCGVRWA